MNIRFYNARILMTKKDRSFEIIQGELWVKGDKIVYIGSEDGVAHALQEKEIIVWDRSIDAEGNLLMPGFKNAHTHTAMTFLRSYADDMALQDWLTKQVFPKEDQLLPEDVYWLTILGIMEYLTSGVTANFDMYFYPMQNAKAAVDCGFRMVQTSGLNNFKGSLEELEEDYCNINKMSELTSFILGFHAEYTNSMKNMEGVAQLAQKYKSPVYLHNAETKAEVEQCIERWGKTPTELTDALGMYQYGGGGYHCIWMSDRDIEIFKRRKLYVVTNPCSNLKLASGIAPVSRFLKEKIPVALGTDGPASNNALDLFREMYLMSTLAKVRDMDAASVPAEEVLYSATCEGAHAMGIPECDRLEVGKMADLILLDLQQPNMQPNNNLVKNIVYAGNKSNVIMTMVNGKILYEKGEFQIGFDRQEIYHRANDIIGRMKA